jgi:hypothetical protein
VVDNVSGWVDKTFWHHVTLVMELQLHLDMMILD